MAKEESPFVLPRNYGLVVERSGTDLFIPPANFAVGNAIRTPEAELNKKLEEWQIDQRKAYEQHKNGREEYRRLFLIDSRHEELLSLRPILLREKLVEAIKRKETARNLWRVGGGEAIEDGYLGKRVLTGRIKAKHDARRRNILRTWQTIVREGSFDFIDSPEYKDVSCQCPDHQWDRAKGVAVVCIHAASLLEYLYSNSGLIEKEVERKPLWIPFNFMTNELSEQFPEEFYEASYIAEENPPPRHVLEMDIIVSHYLLGKNYFEINKELTRLFPIFGPGIIEGIREGKYCFGAIRQKRQKRSETDYGKAIIEMQERLSGMLREKGFRPSETYALEFRDTPNETFCKDYTRGDVSIRVLFNKKFPPVVIERRNGKPLFNPTETDYNARHPFAQLFEKQERIDDKSRRRTYFEVRLPRGIEMPGILKEHYRACLENYFQGNRNHVINEHRLR